MNEVENLILEHLRQLRERQDKTHALVETIAQDMRAMKGHMAAFMQNEVVQDSAVAELRLRIERIEKRLELSDQ